METKRTILFTLLLILLCGVACSPETGQLDVYANGEDFVRDGFLSKDGWQISFDDLQLNLENVTVYQTDPPFNAASGDDPSGSSTVVADAFVASLVQADGSPRTLVAQVDVPVGHYNAIGWRMINGTDGVTVRMVGSAEKQTTRIQFDIEISETYRYVCGEYVGDSRKGFVTADSPADVEMTFHVDHVFGDGTADPEESLNVGALGFDPLAALATDSTLSVTQADLEAGLSSADYATLLDTLATLGHVGEGHCFEAQNGYTDKSG